MNLTADEGSKILFLDLEALSDRHNVVHTVCEAKKHPDNPLLPLGDLHEWDSRQARPWEGSVLYDAKEGLFKCWYGATDVTLKSWGALGYAVSSDGVHWEKPELGLHEYRGSRKNNICLPTTGRVVIDDAEPDPNRRFKILSMKRPPAHVPRAGYSRDHFAGYSPDGVHWTLHEAVDIPGWEGPWGDLVALVLDPDDPDPDRRFKLVWQNLESPAKPGPPLVRTKYLVYGPELDRYTGASRSNPILTPNDGVEDENHFLMLAPYNGDYVMPYEYGWYVPDGRGKYRSYRADVRLAVSRDGERFKRVQPGQKIISRGRRGEWDDGFLVISDKLIVKDDTLYLYYCGQGQEWTSWPSSHNMPEESYLPATGWARLSRMGLATLRLDGFTCLESFDRETPGYAVTLPIARSDERTSLYVNVSCVQQDRSWVAVEILDPGTGETVKGFTRSDCRDLSTDAVRAEVAWADRSLSDLNCPEFRLRFWIYGAARLHAFGFREVS
jgi:hypothetical protein